MELFWPERVLIENGALNYEVGRRAYETLRRRGIPVEHLPASGRSKTTASAKTPREYQALKKVLLLAVHKKEAFETCKPSADFCLPLAGGCPGMCQYCYLSATFDMRPFIRLYVNLEEILSQAAHEIQTKAPDSTFFEGSAIADTLALEHIGGSVAECITFFGAQEHGRFRFVTKYDTVGGLLNLDHNGHTKIRFSINSQYVVHQFEQRTASLEERMNGARQLADAGYPVGFIVAPIIRHDGWMEQYAATLDQLVDTMGRHVHGPLTFELIQHRFTPKQKRVIMAAYPATKLPLNEADRRLKPGKFRNAGKYVYPKPEAHELQAFLEMSIRERFPTATIEYFT